MACFTRIYFKPGLPGFSPDGYIGEIVQKETNILWYRVFFPGKEGSKRLRKQVEAALWDYVMNCGFPDRRKALLPFTNDDGIPSTALMYASDENPSVLVYDQKTIPLNGIGNTGA
jgi:hypothetical protein